MSLLLMSAEPPPLVEARFTSGRFPQTATFSRSSSGTITNKSGLLESLGINEPRFNYGGSDNALLGLLVEPQATNTLIPSVATSAMRSLTNATMTNNVGIAPDGTNTAILLTSTTATTYARSLWNGLFSGSTATYSLWVKAGTQTSLSLRLQDVTTGAQNVINAVGTGTWQRVSVSLAMTPGGSVNAMFLLNAGGISGTSFVGASAYFWGEQLEAGSVSTSYIPTTASAATRAADQLSLTIPKGVSRLRFVFDDNSTQDIAVTAGSYTVPTNLNRANIKYFYSL